MMSDQRFDVRISIGTLDKLKSEARRRRMLADDLIVQVINRVAAHDLFAGILDRGERHHD
jgi:hypothetical protein